MTAEAEPAVLVANVRVFDDSELAVIATEFAMEAAAKLCEAATEMATVRVGKF